MKESKLNQVQGGFLQCAGKEVEEVGCGQTQTWTTGFYIQFKFLFAFEAGSVIVAQAGLVHVTQVKLVSKYSSSSLHLLNSDFKHVPQHPTQ